jgi:peptide/nickel transport system ATP-binding protein
MYLGRIVEYGPVQEVLERPLHPYTAALLDSVPVADPGRKRQVIKLGGDMPSPSRPPPGCHFHPRCPKATALCAERYPDAIELPGGRRVSCWMVDGTDQEQRR